MSFDRPWALALLVLPAILLWLRARAARPRAAEASSLLVWNKVSPVDTVPERPRPPIAAWLEAAGAALLAIGMAGPTGPAQEAYQGTLLLDTSPSMGEKRGNEVRRLASRPGALMAIVESTDPERDLPALLASGRPVVVVTDHRLPGVADDPPRLRVVGLGTKGFNAGITAVSGEVLPDGRWRVLFDIEAHGVRGPVEGKVTIAHEASTITLQPGVPLRLERVVKATGGGAWVARVAFPGDLMEEDDGAQFWQTGGDPVSVGASEDPELAPVVRALVAAGARLVPAESREGENPLLGEVDVLLRANASDRRLELLFLNQGPGCEKVPINPRAVTVADHPLTKDVRIDPSVDLGTAREAPPKPDSGKVETVLLGAGLILENGKALAVFNEAEGTKPACVTFRFIPGGTWVERDPSFVVFAKNLVEFAGNGPARIAVYGPNIISAGDMDRVVDIPGPKETCEAAEGETFGDLRAAIEEARRPDPATRTSFAFLLLMTGAGALFAAWLGMR